MYKIAEKSAPKQHAEKICKLVARLLKRFREDLTDRVNSAKMEASSALPLLKLNREDCTELHRQIEKTAGAALSEDRRQRLIALAKVVVEMGAS